MVCESKPCIGSCDRDLLKFCDDKIVFELGESGCNFCKECADSCMSTNEGGISTLDGSLGDKIEAVAKIEPNSCLAWNGVICYNCFEACKFRAIEYFGVFRPLVNSSCVGCGECVVACFKSAVKFKGIE